MFWIYTLYVGREPDTEAWVLFYVEIKLSYQFHRIVYALEIIEFPVLSHRHFNKNSDNVKLC